MAGTFELLAKTADFTELSRTMAATAAQLAKAKAEADKQAKKAEEAAMAKLDDFIISDKNNYTQKFLPYAKQSMSGLIDRVAEDKTKYPNTWTNLVTQRILDAKNELNWALEQSNTQRDIEKSAQEGFMVPESLLKAYKSNYGDVSDITSNQVELARYGIVVGEDGSIGKDLAKPVNIQREIERVQTQKGRFVEQTPLVEKSKTPGWMNVIEVSTIKPEERETFKTEMIGNRDLRRTYMVNDKKFAEVNKEFDALKTKFPDLDDAQLVNAALDNVIAKDIDTANFDIKATKAVQESKGMTVNVGEKAKPISLKRSTFTNQVIGGQARAGVNMQYIWQVQGKPEFKGSVFMNRESNVINTKTNKPLSQAEKDALIQTDAQVMQIYNKGGKVVAIVKTPLPFASMGETDIRGYTEYEVEIEKGDNFDTWSSAFVGDTALAEAGVSSIFDYIKSLKPQRSSAAPAPAPAAAPTTAPAKSNTVKGKSGKTWLKT